MYILSCSLWEYINFSYVTENIINDINTGVQLDDDKYYLVVNTDTCNYELKCGSDITSMEISNVKYNRYYVNKLTKAYGFRNIFISKDTFGIYYRGCDYTLSIQNNNLMFQDMVFLWHIKHLEVSSYGMYLGVLWIEVVLTSAVRGTPSRAFFYIDTKTGLFQGVHSGKSMSKNTWVLKYL